MYFGGNSGELRLEGEVGFASDGAVLTGKKSVELARALEEARAAALAVRRGEEFARVEDYDPVLRAHCRLTE
jgi:hypothetical protein